MKTPRNKPVTAFAEVKHNPLERSGVMERPTYHCPELRHFQGRPGPMPGAENRREDMTHCPRCGKDNPAEVHTCTPKALLLADLLEKAPAHTLEDGTVTLYLGGTVVADRAAAELRRLYEAHEWQYTMAGEQLRRIEKLEALLRQALEALEAVAEGCEEPHVTAATITAIKGRLGETDGVR